MNDPKDMEREDRDLIRRMASKDAIALDVFYSRYKRLAFTLIVRIVGNADEAEDVLVDVFWQVWQQAGRYESNRGKPLAWLLTIARTRAIDSIRASGRRNISNDPVEPHVESLHAEPEADAFVLADTRRAVREALADLPAAQRSALEMAYFQGMTHTEIASELQQPLGTIKDRIRNGMMHLRKRLRPYL